MTGSIAIVGLGPGDERMRTPQAAAALEAATDLVGYTTYLARIPARSGQARHGSDNREEMDRARHALRLAHAGRRVAIVSSGDPGVFAMASAVFEAVENGDPSWRTLDIEVAPGISAMFAAAARVGAPLGHDFCAISLSDNLKPWALVLHRVKAVAEAGFVIALYNPASRARPWQLGAVLELLRAHLPRETPVVFASAVGRADERILVCDLARASADDADMRTIVLIGSRETRTIPRTDANPFVYTPRSTPS